jgi:hypothetical protein
MKPQKTLYCPRCQNYPDEIIEKFFGIEEVVEKLVWNSDLGRYEVVESNLDNEEYYSYCSECGHELEETYGEDSADNNYS